MRRTLIALQIAFASIVASQAALAEVSLETFRNQITIKYDFEIPQMRGISAAVAEKINDSILKNLPTLCEDIGPWQTGGSEEISSETRLISVYVNKSFVSLETGYSYYCRGPYPSGGTKFLSYDLQSGEALTLSGIFRDWKKDRETILRMFYPKRPQDSHEPCDEDYASLPIDSSISFDFQLKDNGLLLQPDLPHVSDACESPAVVPYKALVSFANPEGPIAQALADKPSKK